MYNALNRVALCDGRVLKARKEYRAFDFVLPGHNRSLCYVSVASLPRETSTDAGSWPCNNDNEWCSEVRGKA
jgi:hypothetical protein